MLNPRLLELATLDYDTKHIGARKALVHETAEVQISVYVLEPGGFVPSHHHTSSWDISVILEGELDVTYTEDGATRTMRCRADNVNLVPPGLVHEISNPSETKRARYLLIQSPGHCADFVPATTAASS